MPAPVVARVSAPLAGFDAPANAITDAMNAAVPWLWWPLAVPDPGHPLPAGAHVLYAVHAVVLDRAARQVGARVPPAGALAVAALGWVWFTGAWDRRALASRRER